MKTRVLLSATTAVAALMLATPALAQTTADAQSDSTDDGQTAADAAKTDIIVTGIRGSIEKARDKKQNSKQIVDAVVAEDVGKLPDNNVPEALARVPGVQIDRVHGEGSSVTIRGLSDIQTTINGSDVGTAGARAMNLADIPAELLKSVEVYKTRSADQVEGGIAGTVNVELRRPLDLDKGLTVAGSFRETFSDIGNTKSPYASLLLADRWETGIGEMGLLINASYTENHYQENYVVSESPIPLMDFEPGYADIPPELNGNLIIPYAVNYGVEAGVIKRPSINVSYQWRPSDQLDFVLEGSYFGTRENFDSDRLHLNTHDFQSRYSNIVANDDGTIRSLTMNNPNGVPGGSDTLYRKQHSNTWHTNFETHWQGGIAHINLGLQYDWSKNSLYYVQTETRYVGGTQASVDFNSDNVPGGGPFITFPGVDITDPAQNGLFRWHDQIGDNDSHQFVSTVDLTLDTSDTGLLRSLQAGYRFTSGAQGYKYGYRDAYFFNAATRPTLADASADTGIPIGSTTPDIRNIGETPTWINFNGADLYANWDSLRQYMIANGADPVGNDLTTERASYNDLGSQFREHEKSFAAYGILNYGFDAGFPVDGQLGLRYVNTWGDATSTQYAFNKNPDGTIDYTLVTTQVTTKANYMDLLPSATAILHFDPKLQLRLSYTHNVQRPSFYDLRPFQELRDAINSPTGPVYSGNPDLKPITENNFDASLEYYFGRGGQLSAAAFLKKQKGFIYYTMAPEYVPAIDRIAQVGKPRNAGPGKILGFEFTANTFFDFLGGFAKDFGINSNFTYIPKSRLELYPPDEVPDVSGIFDAPYTSKYSGNVAFFYDTPQFSARIAYNFRSKYKTSIDYVNPGYSVYTGETSRLDAAINYTPVKFLTLSLEATNLLHDNANQYFGAYNALPVGVREQARTFQASARFRF
ncbi:MAG TPA: TonB-dependent receptor [Sphingomonas sp.]|nr:TonB-dependent receptor [Sphingomonas sp.]